MSTDLISNSLKIDQIVQEKLKSFWQTNKETHSSMNELKSELNNLKYLIYILNQDRINLRQELMSKDSLCDSITEFQMENDFPEKNCENVSEKAILQYELYELTGNSSEICTVVNTSILANSNEPTEREFSPFNISPMRSPRFNNADNKASTVFLTTDASLNRNKISQSHHAIEVLRSDDFIVSDSENSEINISVFTLNSSNYIPQHIGDEVLSPSCLCSRHHSRENSDLI